MKKIQTENTTMTPEEFCERGLDNFEFERILRLAQMTGSDLDVSIVRAADGHEVAIRVDISCGDDELSYLWEEDQLESTFLDM
jgi:hypothetical protein